MTKPAPETSSLTLPPLGLNASAAALCDEISSIADVLHVAQLTADCGTKLFDFGIYVPSSLEAGLLLAKICLSNKATVSMVDSDPELGDWPLVAVATDQPVAACMASQYAGWEVKGDAYLAMGSGPMRAAAGRETIFESIGFCEQAERCVGVLESSKLPTEKVCQDIATKCGIDPQQLILLVAPTSSLAGTVQVVARSVETALHKLFELGFDLHRVVRAKGTAPLCPVAANDLAAIGVTNDAILYGGRVTLEVTGDDASLNAIGPQVPSSSSNDYGRPFVEVLARYKNDFYQVDPLLFSTAQITLKNVDTGNRFEFGQLNPKILRNSFASITGQQT